MGGGPDRSATEGREWRDRRGEFFGGTKYLNISAALTKGSNVEAGLYMFGLYSLAVSCFEAKDNNTLRFRFRNITMAVV